MYVIFMSKQVLLNYIIAQGWLTVRLYSILTIIIS